ncbi:S8 family serine peptidase [Nocardia sp. NRRL S-836]|uniref:S8 family peptidase n=1 Tax=Nocardia sp. NRRL S-836 TaxID=1519492 RepID=UPI0006AF97AD|nr:S8 family serine peptidase [Nocardia sp. NRRL S-836]KOV85060.1 peptidase S8/S53 subtilisin kexin sedolisin [Nocardia sp. NRRL S-836]
MRRVLGAGLAAAAAACLAAAVVPAASAQETTGTILGADRADVVQDSYIVSLKAGTASRAAAPDLASRYGGKVRDVWQHALNGFSVTMSAKQAARLAADPRVDYVQQDAQVRMLDVQQNPPSWGLDRVDQRDLPLSNSYQYDTTASNVTAYVIDTGVRTTHQTFGGRATWGTNTSGDGNNSDCNGHGTHVAGTIAGAEYGLAKAAKIVAVKVLNCQGSGTTAGVVSGIDWVTANAVKPAVANMSLGGGADATLDAAVRRSIAAGVTYAIASGNSNTDACSTSPARVTEAITVNASTNTDARASFSNYGSCTDIYAPGQNIVSSWNTNDTATNNISGTSMATPHVAGAAALWLATHPTDSPAAVWNGLNAASTPNKITNVGANTPNKLLYTLWGGGQPGSPSVANPGAQTSTVGTPVSLQLSATGGTPPYSWTVSGLPAGLTASSSGAISGTPTTAGTYSVTATVTDSAGKTGTATFSWTVNAVGGSCDARTNSTPVAIPDQQTVTSTIVVSGCAGNASATSTIKVSITHTYKGDLVVDLVAPDGTVVNLHNRSGGSADNINETYTKDLSGEAANGTWTLRVRDAAFLDTGTLNSWTLDV